MSKSDAVIVDPLSVPFNLLPLQATLWFETLSADIAIPFLHQVAKVEHVDVTPHAISLLCAAHADNPSPANVDLRNSLLQLQALGGDAKLCKLSSQTEQGNGADVSPTMRCVSRVVEDLSYADAELERRAFMRIEVIFEFQTVPNLLRELT